MSLKRETQLTKRHGTRPREPGRQEPAHNEPLPGFVGMSHVVGNRGVGHLLRDHLALDKLKTSPADDRHEREADRVAKLVIDTPGADVPSITGLSPRVQRKCAACSSGLKSCSDCVEEEEEEERVQAKPITGRAAHAAPGLIDELRRARGGGQPLSAEIRAPLERRFGRDLGGVRIHTDSRAARAAATLKARAFTYGQDIWFGKGQYDPSTVPGQHLLAHELTHTIQQRGRTPQPRSRSFVGDSNDPAETTAGRAADAVLGDRPVPALTSTPLVVRRALVTCERNQALVRMRPGAPLYRVTRRRRAVPVTRRGPRPPSVRPGIDLDTITLRLEWCHGTRGHVTVGADVPRQLRGLLGRIVGVIRSGGSADDVVDEIERTEVTPSVEFEIARSGEWQLSGGVSVTVGEGGVGRVRGRLEVRRGPLGVGVSVFGGEGELGAGAELTYTPGQGDPRFTCPTRERVEIRLVPEYTCERFEPAPEEERTRPIERRDTQIRYIYFNYAQDTLNNALPEAAEELRRLTDHLANGYRVTSIVGFASPEGPHAPGRRFQGNLALAQERAEAALREVNSRCPGGAQGGQSCLLGGATPTGRGELYTLTVGGVPGAPEVEGVPQARYAVGEFQVRPEEERHRTQAVMQQLQAARTPTAQAGVVYPYLRRAEITLVKVWTEQERYTVRVPAAYRPVSCPDEVLEAWRQQCGV